METGDLIVYTSADSVFQIAAHEEIVPLEELNDICRKVRKILTGKHSVGRVIADPLLVNILIFRELRTDMTFLWILGE